MNGHLSANYMGVDPSVNYVGVDPSVRPPLPSPIRVSSEHAAIHVGLALMD